MSLWTHWSVCSTTCGGGNEVRTRSIKVHPENGGTHCPTDKEQSRVCGQDICPSDCVMQEWSPWSICSKSCGGGTHVRARVVLMNPINGGAACPTALSDVGTCRNEECPVDCAVRAWGHWSSCSHTCSGGYQQRTRVVMQFPANGGIPCGVTSQGRDCGTHKCPEDCSMSTWTPWSTCTATCNTGSRQRIRFVLKDAQYGGEPCPVSKEEVASCNDHPCPLDCMVLTWSVWSSCSLTCAGGIRHRYRNMSRAARNGGVTCPELNGTEACSEQPCPVDCRMLVWTQWTDCTRTCGNGLRLRKRSVAMQPQYGGAECPNETSKKESCVLNICEVDCETTTWTQWSHCSATCGEGKERRNRKVTHPSQHGGIPCPEDLKEARKCQQPDCPIDCSLDAWTAWFPCSKSCDGGSQTRFRAITVQPAGGGKACPPEASEERSEERTCGNIACPSDCAFAPWTAWSNCPVSCGGGKSIRNRSKIHDPLNGGAECKDETASKPCNEQVCPGSCVMEHWSTWSVCSKTCGGGESNRHRHISKLPDPGGKPCPNETESTRTCWPQHCPVDCHVHPWGEWSVCSATCGIGISIRVRIMTSPTGGGNACPGEHTQHRACSNSHCPRDCLMDSWTGCTPCSRSCGGGAQERTRIALAQPQYGGKGCPTNLRQMRNCSTNPCPEDCAVGNWTPGKCSVTCGVGTAERTRPVLTPTSHGGKDCPLISERYQCVMQPCATDCVVSTWTEWSACTELCGGGWRERHRSLLADAEQGGTCTLDFSHNESCNTADCPHDCIVTNWTKWSHCSRSCGGGRQFRNRTVQIVEGHNGTCDQPRIEEQDCKTQVCCQYSDWNDWLPCSKTCDHGTRKRKRTFAIHASDCPFQPHLELSESCLLRYCHGSNHTSSHRDQGAEDYHNNGSNVTSAKDLAVADAAAHPDTLDSMDYGMQGPNLSVLPIPDDNDKANSRWEGTSIWGMGR